MLLRFGVQNHLSIRDHQELSCIASREYDDLPHTIAAPGLRAKEAEVLPVIAVYGANAAGKSNLLDALTFFAKAVRRSYIDWDERRWLPHRCFTLDNACSELESMYDCDILIDGVRHQYGFAMNKSTITKEWLYSYPKGIRNVLFQRSFSKDEFEIYFGPNLKGITPTWRALAEKRKVLLLSAAGRSEHRHEKLSPVFDYFRSSFVSVKIGEENQHMLAEQIASEDTRARLTEVLKSADFGIVGIELETVEVPPEATKIMAGLVALFKDAVPADGPQLPPPMTEQTKIQFRHRGRDGETFLVDYENESSGTKYLMSLLVPVMAALENGSALIVDEITTNLHTKLSEKILDLFTDVGKNKKHAQFIFSTHDTNLLSRELLRRDEIWFAEKNEGGETSIYPLSDFKIRKNDNVERGYLQGRFGAIPFMGDVSLLMS